MKNTKRILALLLMALLLLGGRPVPTAYAVDNLDDIPAVSEDAGEESQSPEESSALAQEDGAEISGEDEAEPISVIDEPAAEGDDGVYEPEVVENETYILAHATREYAGTGETLLPMDFVYLAYTLVDASAFEHPPTLDELWMTNEDGDHISDYWESSLGQFESCTLLYSLDADADYYVGYVPAAFSNATLVDWIAGSSNAGQGTEYNDIIFDAASSLIYVPKSYTDFNCEDFGDAVGRVRLQILYTTSVTDLANLRTTVNVNINDISPYSDPEAAETLCLSESCSADVLTMAGNTEIQLPANVFIRAVSVAGLPLEREDYSYDRGTGVLTIEMSPVMIGTVDIDIERDPIMPAYLPPSEYPRTGPIDRSTMESQLGSLDSLGSWTFASTPHEGDAYIIKSGTVAGYYSQVGGTNPNYKKPSLNVYGPYKGQPEALLHFLYYDCYMSQGGELLYVKWSGFSKTNSTGRTPIQRYVQFSAQSSGISQDSPSGREITSLPSVDLDLFCAHVGIPNTYDEVNFSTGDTWYNKDEDYIVNEPIMVRVVYVSDDESQAVVIVCTATVQTQAGVGAFRIDLKPPTPPGFPFSIKKTSAKPDITGSNGCYSLAGAVYGVYYDSGCTSLRERLTTDGSGNATTSNLYEPGTYYLREISASPGYRLDTTIYTLRVDASGRVSQI